jgi:hypothetical protein
MSQEKQNTEGLQGYKYFDDYDNIREIMKENLSGERLSLGSLDRIKVPAGGAILWEITTINGTESVNELCGVVVHEQKTRTYWELPFEETGGDVPPDCFSEGLLTGQGNPGGECGECPFGQFGPNNERPECREGRVLFLLCKDSALPVAVNLPPSSLRAYTEYKVRLSKGVIRLQDIETRISLEKDKNKKGISFARAVFRAGARASAPQKALLAEQGTSVKALLEGVAQRKALPPKEETPKGTEGAQPVNSDIGV